MKWEITVRQQRDITVEVDAENYFAADRMARDAVRTGEFSTPFTYAIGRDVKQLGEPWVRCAGYHDVQERKDLVAVDRSIGHAFTQDEIDELRRRLGVIGLKMIGFWNGVNCDTVTFNVSGRKNRADMTPQQLAVLIAPHDARPMEVIQ